MTEFETIAREHLSGLYPNAYDIEQASTFVARFKTPNEYASGGFREDYRFLAQHAARVIAETLGNGWQAVEGDTPFAELGRIENGAAVIMLNMEGFGANAYRKLRISAFVRQHDHTTKTLAEINVSADKSAEQVARDVERRALKDLDAATSEAADKARDAKAAADRLAKKHAHLERKYGHGMRFSIDGGEIRCHTKYGGTATLNRCRIVERETPTGYVWRLYGDGCAFSLDDIDNKTGRAILKAFADA